MLDAVVVGSGPNGLAAALTLASEGLSVRVLEAEATIGGGLRSAELTLPGFTHDVCSAVHPLVLGSPFFRELGLSEAELRLVEPPAALAHPFDDGTAALLERSPLTTAATLGADGEAYRRLVEPLVRSTQRLTSDALQPLRMPRHPLVLGRFARHGVRSSARLVSRFAGERAPALIAGMAAHSMLRLEQPLTAGFGLLLTLLGHATGWPIAAGGSQRIADALVSRLAAHGGAFETGRHIASLEDLPAARAVLLDLTPRQALQVAGSRLPPRYRRALERYRYGPGAFKLDWALDEPIPWQASECARAATVHLGGTFAEIAAGERSVWEGVPGKRPFTILVQPTLFDPSRAPAGKHVAWAYCHVPNGSELDMTDRIEAQVERFAPGFRERILARNGLPPAELERRNANHVGGDINGGLQDLRQHFARPVASLVPYATPIPGVYLCSSSTPPGGGVHGMCGYLAARAALRRTF
jgi:phytoene dehydrogenase-like protein